MVHRHLGRIQALVYQSQGVAACSKEDQLGSHKCHPDKGFWCPETEDIGRYEKTMGKLNRTHEWAVRRGGNQDGDHGFLFRLVGE